MDCLYISPVTLLNWEPDMLPSEQDIRMARKRWLAELDLLGAATIPIYGKEYGKQEIIDIFDRLQGDLYLPYHLAVAKDPVMLHFLETGDFTKGQSFGECPEYEDEAFIVWIVPYVIPAFQKQLAAAFATGTAIHAAALYKQLFIPDDSESEAWKPAGDYLQRANAFMEYFNGAPCTDERIVQMRQNITMSAMQLLCLMPPYLYQSAYREYCLMLVNLIDRVHESGKRQEAVALLQNALNLPMDEDLRNTYYKHNLKIYLNNGARVSPFLPKDENIPHRWYKQNPESMAGPPAGNVTEKKGGREGWAIAALIILIIRIIIIFTH